jgi:hypothetical protein
MFFAHINQVNDTDLRVSGYIVFSKWARQVHYGDCVISDLYFYMYNIISKNDLSFMFLR